MSKQPLSEADFGLLSETFISRGLAESAGILRVDSHNGAALVGRDGGADYSVLVFSLFSTWER
jgi:hypothetical protein